jgi:hypothetical protein
MVFEENKKEYINEMNEQLKSLLPGDIEILGYSEHNVMLPYSPTTLKKDRNKMMAQKNGYIQVVDENLCSIELFLNEDGKYSTKCVIMDKDKVKSLTRK